MDELARRGIRLPRGVTVCPENAGGVHSEWSEPGKRDEGRVLLYLHGGGYCICSLDTHRGLVARLALTSRSMALAAAYRLAPENPFPAALADSLTAYRWLLEHGYPSKQIAIGGDSAGGGLTLILAGGLRMSVRVVGDARQFGISFDNYVFAPFRSPVHRLLNRLINHVGVEPAPGLDGARPED